MSRPRRSRFAAALLGAATCFAVTAQAQGPSDAVPVEREPRRAGDLLVAPHPTD